jgi:hypothetical protein
MVGVGWVERQRNPPSNLDGCMMGFVSLDPSYALAPITREARRRIKLRIESLLAAMV